MRYITKTGNGGYHLNHANNDPPKTSMQAVSRWSRFAYKTELTNLLETEQYGLCAYSELRPDQSGLRQHIEHVQPKSAYPQRTFDYQNLVLCALSHSDLSGRAKEDVFGGHAKLNDYDANQFISCLDANCSHYFRYLSDGRVVPNNHLDTIEKTGWMNWIN